MPSWITIFHLYFSGNTYTQREEFWVCISIGLAFCALLAALVTFAENARAHVSDETRCANAKLGTKIMLCMIPCIALGNYAGMLAAIATLVGLCVVLFIAAKGIVRSFGVCKTSA